MNTKKPFLELLAFLEENKDKKISSILDDVKEMTAAKKHASTVLKNSKDEITHIFCYYHKQWEDVKVVEYGSKKSSATGYNQMCKIGVNTWTKQQAEAKKAKAQLLEDVGEGKVQVDEITANLAKIEKARQFIDMEHAPKGMKELPKQ